MKFLQHRLLLFFLVGLHFVVHGMEEVRRSCAPVKEFSLVYVRLKKKKEGVGLLPREIFSLICEYIYPSKLCAEDIQKILLHFEYNIRDFRRWGSSLNMTKRRRKNICKQTKRIRLAPVFGCVSTLIGHTGRLNSVSFIEGGDLVTGSDDGTIRLWDGNTYECIATFNQFAVKKNGEDQAVNSVASRKNCIVSGSSDGMIKIWDSLEHSCLGGLNGHTDQVNSLVFTKKGILVSASWDKTIKLWNLKKRKCLATLAGHKGGVYSLVVMQNGTIASGGADRKIKLWNPVTYECFETLIGHNRGVYSLACTKDHKLVSGSSGGIIKFWDCKTLKCIKTLKEFESRRVCRPRVSSLTCTQDGEIVASFSNGALKVYNSSTYQCVDKKRKNGLVKINEIRDVACVTKDKVILCGDSSDVRVWEKIALQNLLEQDL